MRLKLAAIVALALAVAGCGSKGEATNTNVPTGKLTIGASLSSTGQLAREGTSPRRATSSASPRSTTPGGVPVGGKKLKLDIQYQDDTSKPDTAAQLVDQFNDKDVKLILSSYGSANTEAQAAVVERNGQVMADSRRRRQQDLRARATSAPSRCCPRQPSTRLDRRSQSPSWPSPSRQTIVFLSADDGFSKTATEGGIEEAKQQGFTVLPPQYFPNGTSDVSSALTKVKGAEARRHHRLGPPGRRRRDRQAGARARGHAGRRFGESVAPPTPDFVKTLGGQAENVLGSSQWTETTKGQDKYFGTAEAVRRRHPGQVRPRPRVPRCRGDSGLPCPRARRREGRLDRARTRSAMPSPAWTPTSFFGRIKFDAAGKNSTSRCR